MTLTITIRVPAPRGPQAGTAPVGTTGVDLATDPPGITGMLRTLLPLAEPAALLVAEAAGLGLVGRIICGAAVRSVRHALAA